MPTADTDTANTLHIQDLLIDIVMSTCWGQTYLSHVPAQFGEMTSSVHAAPYSRTLLNSEVVRYAHQAMHFNWALYSFSNGHFLSSIESWGLPFTILPYQFISFPHKCRHFVMLETTILNSCATLPHLVAVNRCSNCHPWPWQLSH